MTKCYIVVSPRSPTPLGRFTVDRTDFDSDDNCNVIHQPIILFSMVRIHKSEGYPCEHKVMLMSKR